MKLLGYLALSSLVLAANAADCTAPNQQWFSDAAVQMMWSIRAWVCPNAWSQSITAGPDGGWCDAGGGVISAYWGSWTIAGMQSEQQCWDITEQIINQCMWYDFASTSYNGGSWTYGGTYAGGWFWADTSKTCTHAVKRDASIDNEGPTNFTLADGTTKKVDKQVWLDFTAEGVRVVREETYV
ncbi:hypothetical protein ETB97_008898 [Aspergillus alliaceus]|uniref:Uncharacterized protein n=1 Tax=Petromyces alliaceus TaxID=209559 RepID=A0A5N6G5X6_PETAA|nr:uncharacterized protein BDW43DRAFT_323759 [Aspergillus alliaceus]KAB8236699.1 hypothetical protein BDW43DRAFT_323759 [Aspergillus alliaceus]KAF5863963.1 hypothetical protein ETB97_008898 [Aspergillus burnettii]